MCYLEFGFLQSSFFHACPSKLVLINDFAAKQRNIIYLAKHLGNEIEFLLIRWGLSIKVGFLTHIRRLWRIKLLVG